MAERRLRLRTCRKEPAIRYGRRFLRCARAVAPHLVAQGWGRIVNISGLAARQANGIVGSIRNVAVAAMTKNLADDLGPSGINVTVVHPGLTVTERTPAMIANYATSHDISEAERHGDRLLVLADGELLFDGTPDELKAQAMAGPGEDLEQAFVGFLKAKGHG